MSSIVAIRVYTNGDSEAAEALRKAIEATTLPATVESRKIARFAIKSPGSSTFTVTLEGGQQSTEGFFVSVSGGQVCTEHRQSG